MRKNFVYALITLASLPVLTAACIGNIPQLQATPLAATEVSRPAPGVQPSALAPTEAAAPAAIAPTGAAVEPTLAVPSPTPLPTDTPQPAPTPTIVKGSAVSTLTPAKLVRVIDGVTIEVTVQGKTYQVRYIGVEPLGDGSAALTKNKQLISGQALNLARDVTDTDAQGRLLRYVYTRAYMVNAELARQGYVQAVATPPDTVFQELLASMEREARGAKRGLWATLASTGTPKAAATAGGTPLPTATR